MKLVNNQQLTANTNVLQWVDEMKSLCQPDQVYWCDGSEAEKKLLEEEAMAQKIIEPLDPKKLPGCFYSRSDKNDVARVEHLTFICTSSEEDTGPTNNWMAPKAAYEKLGAIYRGSMKGRTMYVIPFIMGPAGSPGSKVGIQLSDSVYVTLNMRIMTRMGQAALDQLSDSNEFTRCMHGMADLNIERRFICHFPEDNTIWSVGSAYGGNALLGKKCLALRIGSYLGKTQGWMAEHMLILGIKTPEGKQHYVCAAFPSQCGKTNLAMLIPPDSLKGYEVTTVGDDIAWLRIGPDGRLWAINPEAGFFGVAPGTSEKTNPNALKTVQSNTLFTNVAITPDKTVWWEGLGDPPSEAWDWKGDKWTPASGEKASHPNARFTAPASQCPSISPEWEKPEGVPISAIIFGGRRAKVAPLVYQSFDWQHGTYVGATVASETTAAATGKVGVVRRDPMAMRPFTGYHVGDYFNHWLEMGKKIPKPPQIFHVNWFKTNEEGKFIWPGFGENLRVLEWVLRRVDGKADAEETAIGYEPKPSDLNMEGLDISKETVEELLKVDKNEWLAEVESQNELFDQIGDRLPKGIREEQTKLRERLEKL